VNYSSRKTQRIIQSGTRERHASEFPPKSNLVRSAPRNGRFEEEVLQNVNNLSWLVPPQERHISRASNTPFIPPDIMLEGGPATQAETSTTYAAHLQMSRQEQDISRTPSQDGVSGGPTGPGRPGGPRRPNAQPSQDASPSPADQMKRGTQQMNNVDMGSPLPEGAQTHDSRSPINSIGQNMELIPAQHFNRMNCNMIPSQASGGSNHTSKTIRCRRCCSNIRTRRGISWLGRPG
jgi:hypothetical protein